MLEMIAAHPFWAALLALVSLALVFGAVLGFASVRFATEGNPIAEQINEILPQTQCGQCGYPGCRPYSEAIAQGDAINKCPPGGEAVIKQLADLLDVEAVPLDAEHGAEKPKKKSKREAGRKARPMIDSGFLHAPAQAGATYAGYSIMTSSAKTTKESIQ